MLRRLPAAALAALLLCAPAWADDVVSIPAPPRVDSGVIVRPPSGGALGWMEVDTGPGEPLALYSGTATPRCGHGPRRCWGGWVGSDREGTCRRKRREPQRPA